MLVNIARDKFTGKDLRALGKIFSARDAFEQFVGKMEEKVAEESVVDKCTQQELTSIVDCIKEADQLLLDN